MKAQYISLKGLLSKNRNERIKQLDKVQKMYWHEGCPYTLMPGPCVGAAFMLPSPSQSFCTPL
jgi:hypothetical protein